MLKKCDGRTDGRTDGQTDLCIELRYAQLIKQILISNYLLYMYFYYYFFCIVSSIAVGYFKKYFLSQNQDTEGVVSFSVVKFLLDYLYIFIFITN